MSRQWGVWIAGGILAVLLVGLAWWGWRQGGLALLQLGMGIC